MPRRTDHQPSTPTPPPRSITSEPASGAVYTSAETPPWGRFLPDYTTAANLLDRLLHHAHVIVTDGESYGMRGARQKGESPRPKAP